MFILIIVTKYFYYSYMLNNFERVKILGKILPFIQRFAGRIIVIKYGGSIIKNSILREKVIDDILFLFYVGLKPVLIHGGGHIINSWLRKVNIEPRFNQGIRITDPETMEVVEMALGKINQELVGLINKKNANAIGLSGKDARLIIATAISDSSTDLVGRVQSVNSEIIHLLVEKRYIPVIASFAANEQGKVYNINADTVAGSIAEALKAEKLILLTDTPGIMQNLNDSSTLLKCLNVSKAQELKKLHIISGGMIPKVDCCIQALNSGVSTAHIIDGRVEHALLLEILTNDGIGSTIIPNSSN